jgi:hypothetical protein
MAKQVTILKDNVSKKNLSQSGGTDKDKTYLSKRILDNPAQVPDSNAHTSTIQEPNHLLPGDIRAGSRRSIVKAMMPHTRDDDEYAENDNLENQPAENDVLAPANTICVVGLDQHARAARLDEEAQNVATDEDLGEPVDADNRVVGAVGAAHEPTEDHVHRGGE